MSEMTIIREAAVIAREINEIKQEVKATVVQGAIAIGRKLQEAKSIVPYGEWGKWLEENVNYSASTAQNLMRIADEYGRKETQALGDISYTQAVALLQLPYDEREKFVEEHDMEEISTRELQAEIKRINAEKEKLQLTIDELLQRPEPESQPQEDVKELKQLLADAVNEKKTLSRDVDTAKAAYQAEKMAKEKAQKEREEAKGKLKQLTQDLAEAKAQAAKVERVEVIPEAVEKELQQLRKQAARSGEEVELRSQFNRFSDEFDRLAAKLDAMEAAGQQETAARYRAAFYKGTMAMAERMKG